MPKTWINPDYSSFYSLKISLNSEKQITISSVQFISVAHLGPTLCDPMACCSPGFPVYHQIPEATQNYVHWVSDTIQPPPSLSSILLSPSVFPSIMVFTNELPLRIRWPKYWSFSFRISPSNEYSGLISFSMDWLDLLAVQGTLKSLLQHHSSKASVLWCSAFFVVQLSHPYMTTGKTIAWTRWTFVDKVMYLLLNMLSSMVITFLPRSKSLNFIVKSPCSDFRAQKYKVSHCFHCFPIYLPWSDGTRCLDLSSLNVEV